MAWRIGGKPRRTSEENALAAIILPNLDAAHNLARWLVRDSALAEDVVQDAVVRALSYGASFDGRNARAWLLRIIRNVAYDALVVRRKWSATHVDAGFGDTDDGAAHLADSADDPERALSRVQDHAALSAALEALAVELRECMVLRELEALSYKEIADITGVPVGTVMSRLWRARQILMARAAKDMTP